MRRKEFFMFVSLLVVCAFLSGCATSSTNRGYGSTSYDYDESSSTAAAPPVASLLRFDDVPVPIGFNILAGESFAFQNDQTRVALLKYMGSQNVDLVVDFFKAQMPMYNWDAINVIEYERRVLNYENNVESCIVTIEARGRKSIVTIAISPKSKPMKVSEAK
ncbi:MAG: hypothetical protein QGI05_02460 [Candidatus Omnitrophota bacterium]|jgi:hypothetical protein|nr:hypothetical protein [Candidatus Omnitrophota bacterium]